MGHEFRQYARAINAGCIPRGTSWHVDFIIVFVIRISQGRLDTVTNLKQWNKLSKRLLRDIRAHDIELVMPICREILKNTGGQGNECLAIFQGHFDLH
jgi:hypothetical protein